MDTVNQIFRSLVEILLMISKMIISRLAIIVLMTVILAVCYNSIMPENLDYKIFAYISLGIITITNKNFRIAKTEGSLFNTLLEGFLLLTILFIFKTI